MRRHENVRLQMNEFLQMVDAEYEEPVRMKDASNQEGKALDNVKTELTLLRPRGTRRVHDETSSVRDEDQKASLWEEEIQWTEMEERECPRVVRCIRN